MVRYAIILMAAIVLPIFEEHTERIENTIAMNIYKLGKVAKVLGLYYDRTKIAVKVYAQLEVKGYVKIITTPDKKTFITLTKQGEKTCKENLELLQALNDQFHLKPSLQGQYIEKEGHILRDEPVYSVFTDQIVEDLIKKISSW